MSLLLPDTSEWQSAANGNAPDWAGIKSRNGGAAIIRALYGANHTDEVFTRYRSEIAGLGYSWAGLYAYVVENQDIEVQAEEFVKLVGKLAPYEIPILDLEEGDGNQEARANQWFAVVDKALGLESRPLDERSWLYSGEAFAQEHGLAPIFASARRTWVAAYGDIEPALGHTLWQCTNGSVGSSITDWPGCGRCDSSQFDGTLAELAATTGRTATVTTATPSVREWTTAGQDSLAQLAAAEGTECSTILRLTAENSPSQIFPGNIATWLNDVFAGHLSPSAPMPKGLNLYLPFAPKEQSP